MVKGTIGMKIGAGYALALVLLIALGVTAYWSIAQYTQATALSEHTYVVLGKLRSLLSALQNAETGQRGYLIVGTERYLEPYRRGISVQKEHFDALRKLTADNPAQQKRLDSLEPLIAAKLVELQETIDLRRNKGFDAALAVVRTDKGKAVMDEIRKLIDDMKNEEELLLNQRNGAAEAGSHVAIASIAYGIPAAVMLLLVVGGLTVRQVNQQLKESIAQLSTSAAEILATTTQVASGAAETATAISETTATVEEVKQTAQVSSQKARHVSDSAQKAAQVAQTGTQSVEDTIEGMHRIQEQMESIAESIVRLSEQSQSIGVIIATVNDLAEQSNVLAVNAAIEATKAGEQGKGFGVVAQEVKSLAEQSKQATAQVRAILGDVQKATSAAVLATEQGHKAVDAGVRESAAAAASIRQLAATVSEAAQAAAQIAASSQQQMVGMDQVALAMDSIKTASAQNVAGTRQAETAAQNLHQVGIRLNSLIDSRAT